MRGDGIAGAGSGGGVVGVSTGCGGVVVSCADDMLKMSVIRGVRGVGGLCEIYMCSEWGCGVRGLDLA